MANVRLEDNVFGDEETIETYELDGPKYLFIINVNKYKHGDRVGCKADEQLLKKKFNQLGFKSELPTGSQGPNFKLELTGEFSFRNSCSISDTFI